jgi:hypothetical protein
MVLQHEVLDRIREWQTVKQIIFSFSKDGIKVSEQNVHSKLYKLIRFGLADKRYLSSKCCEYKRFEK